MSGLITFPRQRIITDIEVIECGGVPEFMADGATYIDRGEVMTVIAYTERMLGGTVINTEVARIHYPWSRWQAILDRTNRLLSAPAKH